MTAPGRNDPCPCGSGKKFKHCHLVRAQPSTGITPQDRSAAFDALLRYSGRDEFMEVVEDATLMWAGEDIEDLGDVDDALDSILEFDTSRDTFFDWLFFDLPLDDRRSLSEHFLERRGRSLHPRVDDYIRLMQSTHLHPYQVREARPGEGLRLRDLWTKAEINVTERTASHQLVVWDVLVARVHTHGDGTAQLEGSSLLLPASVASMLIKALKVEHRRLVRKRPDLATADFFKMVGPVFHLFWYDHVAMATPPDLRTVEGDSVTSSTVVFDVPRAGDALVTLLLKPDFEPAGVGEAVWCEPDSDPRRILGQVSCDQGKLTLTTFSRERAARGRARMEALLGPLRLVREAHTEAGSPREASPGARRAHHDDIEMSAVPELAAYLDQRDRAWLDLEIPALDGVTPRAAAMNRRLRPRLVELLVDIENRQARLALQGQGRDTTWMWDELGLKRP